MTKLTHGLAGLFLLLAPALATGAPERVVLQVRGHDVTLAVYRPAGTPRGSIIMGSGDVGWVGLAVSRAQELSTDGYLVAGVNVREYLSAFTSRGVHLTPSDIQHDFATLAALLRARGMLPPPVILSGVSEGAGIAVVAAASPENHTWVSGVITMGLPRTSEIAWRWSDFTSWITKKDVSEPSVDATDSIHGVAPLPIVMLQSRRDEYVTEADFRAMETAARDPRKLVLIDASNHRFTDRIPELRQKYTEALLWVAERIPAR